jgi:glucose-6-phosphate isomerase
METPEVIPFPQIEPGATWAKICAARNLASLEWGSESSGFERTLSRDVSLQQAAVADGRRMAHLKSIVVIGIGGSALGTRAVWRALAADGDEGRLVILDELDECAVDQALDGMSGESTGLYVVSRSGTTLEPLALLREVLARITPAEATLITATEGTEVHRFAQANGWSTLPIPADVGGRFSVLTAVALAPLTAAGIDVLPLLEGARCADPELARVLAADCAALVASGRRAVTQMVYGRRLTLLGAWWVQLLGESLGKAGRGFLPTVAEGPKDQHSLLQYLIDGPPETAVIFLHDSSPGCGPADGPDLLQIGDLGLAQIRAILCDANAEALDRAGRPIATHRLRPTAAAVGAWLQTWMRATADLGAALDVDPYDQPAVEAGKRIAKDQLDASRRASNRPS